MPQAQETRYPTSEERLIDATNPAGTLGPDVLDDRPTEPVYRPERKP